MSDKKLLVKGVSVYLALLCLTLGLSAVLIYLTTNSKIPFPFNKLPINKQLLNFICSFGCLGLSGIFLRMAFGPMAILEEKKISAYFLWIFKWKEYTWDQVEFVSSREFPFYVATVIKFFKESRTLKIFSNSPQYYDFLNFISKNVNHKRIDEKTLETLKDEHHQDKIKRRNKELKTYLYGIWVLIIGLLLLHFIR